MLMGFLELCVLAIVASQANAQQAALGLEAVLSAAGANRRRSRWLAHAPRLLPRLD